MATGVDLAPYVTFHPVHLELREDTPLEVFKATLQVVREMKAAANHNHAPSAQWHLGDAYNFAASQWFYRDEGFSKLDIARETGYDFGVLVKAASLCRSYSPRQRRSKLTHSHHVIARAIREPERQSLLSRAEKEEISAIALAPIVQRMREVERNEEVSNGVGAMVCPYCEGTGIFTHKHKKK